jgi:formylglycine-generating enzyme required for sulfatase activity
MKLENTFDGKPLPSSSFNRKQVRAIGVALLASLMLSACSGAEATAPAATLAEATATASPAPAEATATPTAAEPTPTPTPDATATPSIGSSRVIETDGMVQVYVPAGEFTMGADDADAKKLISGGRAYPEVPVHQVTLEGYWIDKFEVTVGQYEQCVNAGVCKAPHQFSSGYDKDAAYRPKYYGNPEFAKYPVIWVSWFYATDYCGWAGRRLPTEAEWEKAARGTDARKYTWGNDPLSSTVANMCDINCLFPQANGKYNDGWANTAPVGSFPAGASPYGAMDMAGNVWEWTSSLIKDYPYSATDGREDQSLRGERAWRGASWTNGYWWMRVTLRYRSVDWYWNWNLGFRCAASE